MNQMKYSIDAFEQQKLLFISKSEMTIFDVGAYIGDISKKYFSLFPAAKVYSFEPYKVSYTKLKKNLRNYSNSKIFNFAFINENSKIRFNINKFLPTNSILESSENGKNFWGNNLLDTEKKIKVKTKTIDNFCLEENILHVDILKLDTQGSEYMILEGANEMLSSKNISLIYMEIILVDTYKGQKLLPEITDLLDKYNYRLFGIYNPRISNNKDLNQIDAIFLPHGVKIEK